MICSSPSLLSLQLVVSFVDEPSSYRLINRFNWVLGLMLCLILSALAYTPLGKVVFTRLVGLTEPRQIAYAYAGLRITCFLPLVQVLRNHYQGLALSLKKTGLFVPGIVIRLLFISLFLWWTVHSQAVLGIFAVALSWVVGIGIEGIFIVISLLYDSGSVKKVLNSLPPKEGKRPVLGEVIKFFIPLAVMMSLTAFAEPAVQSGLARSALATQSLAVYGVAWSLVMLLNSPLRPLHQLSLVYTRGTDDPNWNLVKMFSLISGLVISLLTIILALTPIGFWLLNTVIAVSQEITLLVMKVLLVFSAYPIIRSLRETYWGLMMGWRNTFFIAISKLVNIGLVVVVLIISLTIVNLHPAVIGALAFITGEIVESLLIWQFSCRNSAQSLGKN